MTTIRAGSGVIAYDGTRGSVAASAMSTTMPRTGRLARPVASAAAWHAFGLTVLLAGAWSASPTLGLGPRYLMGASLVFAAITVVVVSTIRAGHPHARFGPANVVTMGRAGLVSLVAALLGEAPSDTLASAAVVIGAIAVTADGLDGFLARRSGLASRFGARFDMEIDALLILGLSILAWTHDKAGAWVLLAGLMRYAFVAAAWQWPWMAEPLPPSRRRQATCVVQIVGLLATLLPVVRLPVSAAVAAATLTLLSWSFLVDVLWLARRR